MENEINDISSNGNGMEDVTALKQRVEFLEKREKDLVKEKEDMEVEYGLKRAKLKDLYLQKEDELEKERATSSTMRTNKAEIEGENLHLIQELNDYKSQVAIAWESLDNMESEKNKCEEKLASLEQILEETVNESLLSTSKFEKEIIRLKKLNEKLEGEILEVKAQATSDKEGVLSVMTKTLAKRVVNLNAHSQSNENIHENLEESMKKAQEDAEMLRSVVVPLEEEIKALKDKLRAADEQLQAHTNAFPENVVEILKGRTPVEVILELDEKVKEVSEELKAEKSSRSDLEMYVAVLQTQKQVLQEDTDKLRKELQEVCRLLENEKREYNDLKQTWQMANDQFLEVQRLQIMDMRRMQSLLTMEQQRILSEMQKRDEERMEQEKRVQRFFQLREEQEKIKQNETNKSPASPILSRMALRRRKSPSPSRSDTPDGPGLDTPLSLKDFLNLERPKSEPSIPGIDELTIDAGNHLTSGEEAKGELHNIPSSSEEVTEKLEDEDSNTQENLLNRTFDDNNSELEIKIGDHIPNLTEAQFKALADLTPEQEARKQLLQSARARPESLIITSGKRLVSEKEWQLLQEELKKARDKLGRNCDMCSNYEAQLQKVQEHEKEIEKDMQNLENALADCKRNLTQEQLEKKDVEEKAAKLAEDSRKEISILMTKVEELERMHHDLSHSYKSCYTEITSQLKLLSRDREKVQHELSRLQQENDSLVGKHSAHSHQMQNEKIELPTDPDEMMHVLLKLREELIAEKVAKEQMEETLRSEILFMKDRVTAEQHTKNKIEDTLTQEIDSLRARVGILSSIESQLEKEEVRRKDAEQQVKEGFQAQASSKQIISSMQKQIEELNGCKSHLEQEVHQLKCKVQALQLDLDNSEAVQRDFVKLSQSLQVQLEKIRESENEVRWQYDDDVEECGNCKQGFVGANRKKHHCHHCGKIFCVECSSKSVPSGPKRRLSRVCDVCHTLLVRNTAPYFSKEPPQTPD